MSRSRRILTVTLIVAAAAGVVVVAVRVRRMRQVASDTAADIEAQLDALDPMTRAAVVGKLSADAVKAAKTKNS